MNLFHTPHPLEIEANEIAHRLQRKLTRMGMEHRRNVPGADYEERSIVRFRTVEASPECVKIRLDVESLPKGVTTTRLKEEEVLTDLGHALGHTVTFEDRDKKAGCWFLVWLQETNGLPALVSFADFIASYPSRPAPLTIPVGIGFEGPRWVDLRSLPHLLIAGATGKGKSVWLHAIISCLLNVDPTRLHFVFVDLKGGMELGRYKKVPHTSRQHYVRKADELPLLLLSLQAEMQRRADAMEDLADDIDSYNKTRPAHMHWPYIVVVIEELANAMLSKERIKLPECKTETVAVATDRLLADLAARARATGIHIICTTQSPRSDVINGIIKANFPARAAFGTASDIDSRVIVDDSRAQGLEQGRMLFMQNADRSFYQAPMLDAEACEKLIRLSVGGKRWLLPQSKEQRTSDDLLLLLETAHRDLDDVLDVDRLYRAPDIKQRKMPPARIRELIGILHADGVATKGMLNRHFRVAVSPGKWRKKYRNSDVVPADTHAENKVFEGDIIEGEVVAMGTSRVPVPVSQLTPADPDVHNILTWQSLGYSRNEMAKRMGSRRNDALKKINDVLGSDRPRKEQAVESHS
jgi:hypothetical protein